MKNIETFFSPNLTPAYRSQYGSANPTAIIAPAIAATLVSTLVAIVYCKIKDATTDSRIFGSYGSGYVGDGYKVGGKRGKAV